MNEYYECGDGWISLIEEAKTIIAKYNQKLKEEDLDTEPLEFIQIKEKWGGLRIYLNYYVPEIYDKITYVIGTETEPSVDVNFKNSYKGSISAVAIPKDVSTPEWLIPFIDYNTIINDNLCNFPLESIGIRRLGKDKVNYTNIVKL